MRLIFLLVWFGLCFPLALSAQMQMDSTVFYRYTSNQDSVRKSKKEFSYYSSGLKSMHIEYHWDTVMNSWTTRFKREFAYYSDAKLKSQTDYGLWNDIQDWRPYAKIVNVYLDSVNQVNDQHFSWDNSKKEWYPTQMWERRYGIGDKCIMRVWSPQYSAKFNDWIRYYKEEWKQDSLGNLITWSTFRSYTYPTVWTNEFKADYTFNSLGQSIAWFASGWDERTESWRPAGKGSQTYDSHGNRRTSYHFSWDNWNQRWYSSGGERFLNYYDTDDRIYLTRHYCLLPGERWSFSGLQAQKYFSNISGNLYLRYSSWWNPAEEANMPNHKYESFQYADGHESYEAYYNWSANLQDWLSYRKQFNYFSGKVTGIEEYVQSDIVVYPNPAVDRITISGLTNPAQVRILSSDGRVVKVLDQVIQTVDISDLPAGYYYLVIIQRDRPPILEALIKQ